MNKVNRFYKLNRREALIGLTGFAAATPLLAGPGTDQKPKHSAAKALPTPLLVAQGRDIPFDQDWRFHRGNVDGAEAPGFDDSQWRKLDLPHD